MKAFKKVIAIVFVSLFVVLIGGLIFGGNNNQTYADFLTENTSYEWEQTEHYHCVGAYDEICTFETLGNEFQLVLYFNNDEINNVELTSNPSMELELEHIELMHELESALDIVFWNGY